MDFVTKWSLSEIVTALLRNCYRRILLEMAEKLKLFFEVVLIRVFYHLRTGPRPSNAAAKKKLANQEDR